MLWCFFSHHMELMFMKFDLPLLTSISEMLIRGLSANSFEVQSDSTNCINVFCEFVHEKLRRKPTQKSAYLVQCVTNFYTEGMSVFQNFLRSIMYVLLFEDNKNVWIFQKCLHSSLVLCSTQEHLQ